MTALEELEVLLRPAGGGLHLVSTGKAAQLALQRRLYDAATDEDVQARWRASLAGLVRAKAFVLGVPSDVGAGFQRGANLGPQMIRETLLAGGDWPPPGVVDVGDVFVVPQLLHDDMLSAGQIAASRRALYPGRPGEALPVSPLSIEERALDLIFAINPTIKPLVIGGDHSTAWPVAAALGRALRTRWGIVQPDAHTDLLADRLGVKYCFATWSFHANELLGRDGRLVQVGTRASGHDRGHWETGLGVRQFWADECRARPAAVLDELVAHLRDRGVATVYFSNDIDGTDSRHADATGTPEENGLEPDFVVELIRRLGRDVGLCGGDLMEVAPLLRPRPDSTERTLALGARYFRETALAALASTTGRSSTGALVA